ncbi:MAG: hypothetical protein HQ526_06350 [Actinobacteria bacterium]|nr:hypothetical protein [Actinomycetota bacterium]
MTWSWQFLDTNACPTSPPADLASEATFHAQADAETWIGENWEELLESGVNSVNLLNEGTLVYGPMGLHSEQDSSNR